MPLQKIISLSANINIDYTPVDRYLSFELWQKMNSHHQFEVILPRDILISTKEAYMNAVDQFMGKTLTIDFLQGKQKVNHFGGIITGIEICNNRDGIQANVKLSGFGFTILIDNGPEMNGFEDYSIDLIIDELKKSCKEGLIIEYNHSYKSTIPYSVQYKESAFDYLNRLATQHGEWFYSDGMKLYFGRTNTTEENITKLTYGTDLQALSWKMKVCPVKANNTGYDQEAGEVLYEYEPESVQIVNNEQKISLQYSRELFPKKVFSTNKIPLLGNNGINGAQLEEQNHTIAKQVTLYGTSINPALKTGDKVKISVSVHQLNNEIGKTIHQFIEETLGYYIIIAVNHQMDHRGKYLNEFTAVPADSPVIPVTLNIRPTAEPELAEVIDTNDPGSKGRVKVKFAWQDRSNSSWLYVMTPHAGLYDNKESSRGSLFIPEKGDQVVVGYFDNNPERPYVMGSIHKAKTTNEPTGASNDIKRISTRSGHTLEFDDTDEGTSITIKDREGNSILLDTKGKNITITAPETMTLNAKNIVITAAENITSNAGESITETAGQNISANAGGDYSLMAVNITKIAEKNISNNSESHTQAAREEITAKSESENVNHFAQKEVKSNSGEKTKQF